MSLVANSLKGHQSRPDKYGNAQARRLRLGRFSLPTDSKSLRTALHISLAFLAILFVGQAVRMPTRRSLSDSGLEVHALPFGARLVEAFVAVISVGFVTLVYTLLIQRGSLLATTSLLPRRPIETNMGRVLNETWPVSIDDVDDSQTRLGATLENRAKTTIQLFYVGKMRGEENITVAKGQCQAIAKPTGNEKRHPVWLASGSPLTKNVVQIMVWEWVSLWLMILLAISTLMFNGFFTDNLNHDSFPRLTVIMIYLASFVAHFFYIWIICLDFFKLVFGGASWSLLERAKFVVAETHKIRGVGLGSQFTFRSIDKANDDHVPTTCDACLGTSLTAQSPGSVLSTPTLTSMPTPGGSYDLGSLSLNNINSQAELSAAIKTINSAQRTERETATASSHLALERVIANSMVMMGVTISSGFASWTSGQFTAETPNNTSTTQIGSLALLASLSLGAAAMFSSAMHLNITKSSYRTIVSLKETKINGLALDFYRKTRSGSAFNTEMANLKPVAFTETNSIPLADVELADFFAANRDRGWAGMLGMVVMGPGYALLPRQSDHDRKSKEVEFDFAAPVEGGTVTLTTRTTDRHAAKNGGEGNVDPIIACYVPRNKEVYNGTEPC